MTIHHNSPRSAMDGESPERCYLPITNSELDRLAALADEDREEFLGRYTRWDRLYRNRKLCIALCQGAALHFLDGKNGIKDWDVWTFYRVHEEAPFPYRRLVCRAFGDTRFGYSPDSRKLPGRSIDLLGRSIPAEEHEDPANALRRYLAASKTTTARLLAEKAVILLDPPRKTW